MKKKINPSDKVVIVEEELDGIGNVVGLSRLMFINEECGNLQVVVDDGQLTRKMTERSLKVYKHIDVKSVTNAIDEIEVSMIFLVVTFFCE